MAAMQGGGQRRHGGEFGPVAYAAWRDTSLGAITDALERRLIRHLAGEVAGRDVLDVGCGDGDLALACRRAGAARVAACEVDPRMLRRAVENATLQGAAIDWVEADAAHLPFRDGSFDIVGLVTVLAFVIEPEAALREIARVLRPGGVLVLGDLGRWSLWAAGRRVRGWRGAELWRRARFRSAGALRALCRTAGLRVERVAGAVYYPRSARVARLVAPFDAKLGEITTIGAAFVALRARKG